MKVKAKTGPLAYLVYAIIRTMIALVQTLPVKTSFAIAKAVGRGWALLRTKHRKRAIDHLTMCLGDRYSPEQIEKLADRCLISWALFAMELAWAPRLLTPSSWTRYIRLKNFSEALEVLLEDKGAILVTGHYGQFEMTGYLFGCLGFDVAAVMRPLDNVYLNRYVVRSRKSHGLELLDKHGAMGRATSIILDGRPLAFIADQDAGPKGLFVNFFGQPASTYKSIGLLAMRTNRPIIVGYARRVNDNFSYEVGATRIIYPQEWANQDQPLRWITQAYTKAIEVAIREEPSQYLWIHRRWKSKPGMRKNRKKEKSDSLS